MIKRILLLCATLAVVLPATARDYSTLYDNLPVEIQQVSAPAIPDLSVSITDFGGIGDGKALNTKAFADAVSYLDSKGGGHLNVPRGVWMSGPISLKSHIDLHLEQGAMLIFSPDKNDFIDRSKPALKSVNALFAKGCTDISITGKGIIDGSGKYWRYVKRGKVSDEEWKILLKTGGEVSGDLWFPYNLKHFDNVTASGKAEESLRAHMIRFEKCRNILIQGVTVQNSPRFHIAPSSCENMIIDGVTVRCPWNAQNGDGIDLFNCKRVLVTGCTVDVGDDGICMKGGAGEKGLKAGPCKDILIQGNTVFHAHGGFVIGSDMSGGMENIIVRDCTFSGTDNGLRFKSAMDRGGTSRNIRISDITMNDISDAAVTFQCDYRNVTYKEEESEAKSFPPNFTDIHISGVICRECKTAVYALGAKGHRCIHDIEIKDSYFFYTGTGLAIDEETAEITLENVNISTFEN